MDGVTIQLQDHDEDDVTFCQHCLSIKILNIDNTIMCYCGECGNTDVSRANITDWEELYRLEYGKTFLESKSNAIFDKNESKKFK